MNCPHIPFVDLAASVRAINDELMQALGDVVDSGAFILGKELELFEEEFAAYCGTRYCVGVANGSDALLLSLRALGIGAGDEVITAGNSFAATAFAIRHAGAIPVLVDVDPLDFNIDPSLLEEAISPRTRAVIPVHLYGQPAQMEQVCEIASQHGLPVIEDAAQAHGAALGGRRAGCLGKLGCFSFYPAKNLGAFGDGGAVTTDDSDLARRLRQLRNYGQQVKNRHDCLGTNSRLDTIQAAVLLVKLRYLDQWNDQRRQAAATYRRGLQDIPGLVLPLERDNVRHVYHLFVVRHERRDALLDHLGREEISCGLHYPHPLHKIEALGRVRTIPHGLPVCTELASQIMSLPMYPGLPQSSVERVAAEIKSFVGSEVFV